MSRAVRAAAPGQDHQEQGSCVRVRRAALGPGTEGAPVGHDLDQAVLGEAAQRLDDGVAGHAVVLSQVRHRGQPLARFPLPGLAAAPQVCLDLAGGQFRFPWRHAVHDRKPALTCAHCLY